MRMPVAALMAVSLVVLLAACGKAGDGTVPAPSGSHSSGASSTPSSPSTGIPTGEQWKDWLATPTPTGHKSFPPPPSITGIDPALASLVAAARADLAGRLGVPAERIETVAAGAVTWSDRSLGCPDPDKAYAQVPVDGARIVLRVAGADYDYHSGEGAPPFLCGPRSSSP